MASLGPSRSRPLLFVAFAAVIALGLASRRFPFLFPAFLGKYPGDALWALMVFVALAFFRRQASTARLSILTLAISWADELSQLYQKPWINAIRRTTIGHLLLGSTFAWIDMTAYAVGVLLGALLDILLFRAARLHAD
jgi:hypothetical protein